MDVLSISANQWVLNEAEYTKQLLSSDTWTRVPLINVNEIHNFKDGSLVSFRGMIQDMYGPEYYLEEFEVINELTNETATRNGKYCEVATTNNSSEKIKLDSTKQPSERHKFVVVSIPGLNSWVIEQESALFKIHEPVISAEGSPNQCKRTYDDESMDVEQQSTTSEHRFPASKRTASSNQPAVKTNLQVSPEHILNHPLDDKNAKVCHVTVYKEADLLKLNDVCEFVGFLNLGAAADAYLLNDDDDLENPLELQTHNPPASLVPRIHVVHYKSIKHHNPLVEHDTPEIEHQLSNIRKELLILLTQLLMGDALAAEYLICHLLSEVYMRKDFMALGKFSVNISNIPLLQNCDYVAEFYKFLEQLVPKSHYLPLTLQNMNTLSFVPKKDYQCNRLTSGVLQLSHNTVMVLDETKLHEGKLNSAGIEGVKSLASAIKNQKVTYDFNYYPIEYDCDIPFLIFSEGKSMLPSDVHVPLQADSTCLSTFPEILDAARHFLKPELLNSIRVYLTKARLIQYEISEHIQDLVQKEFVSMRQNGKVTAEDLHSLLVLSRLICLSEGKNTLDQECWKKACNMENERKKRLTQQRTSS